jgi:hypothetical protein
MALLMDTHPSVVSVGETAFTPPAQRRGDARQVCSCGALYHECPFWKEIFAAVSADGFDFSPHNWSNDYRYRNRWLHRGLTTHSSVRAIRRLQGLAASLLPVHRDRMRAVDRVNVSFIAAALRTRGAELFFDSSKRPLRVRRLLAVPELDVKVIHLVRDVRGYAGSAKRRGEKVSDAARAWKIDREVINEITQSLPPGRTMLLRYEDLCADPRETARRVYAFLGLECVDPPEVIRPAEHHVLGNRIRLQNELVIHLNDQWKKTLSGEELGMVLRIAGDANRAFGYA